MPEIAAPTLSTGLHDLPDILVIYLPAAGLFAENQRRINYYLHLRLLCFAKEFSNR